MLKSSTKQVDEQILLLQNLLAIELWRAGLSQAQIRSHLGIAMSAVQKMLKHVERELVVELKK